MQYKLAAVAGASRPAPGKRNEYGLCHSDHQKPDPRPPQTVLALGALGVQSVAEPPSGVATGVGVTVSVCYLTCVE